MSLAPADGDPYAERTALLREIRERVADDVHDLIVERQELGSQSEFAEAVRQIGRVAQKIAEARGRQLQAQDAGLPISRAIRDEAEQWALLRATVMSTAGVCAAWVQQMDVEARKVALES